MFEDYRKYILSIRNNLIQCGVEFPVSSDSSYREIFELSHKLDSILWFYSILGISGSEDALKDFFLPLNGYYKDKMRTIFYEEFTDFMNDYKELSVEHAIRQNSLKKGYVLPVQEVEENTEESEEIVENVQGFSEDTSHANENVVNLSQVEEISMEGVEYVSHGRYIEDDISELPEESDIKYTDHGRYIEDEEDIQYVEHGRFVEDYDEEPINEDEQYDTYVEDDWEEPVNEDEQYDTYIEDDGSEYSDPVNEDEQYDTYVEDDGEGYEEPVNEDEQYDTYVEEDYEEPVNEDEQYDTFVEEPINEDELYDTFVEEDFEEVSPPSGTQQTVQPTTKKVVRQRDLSDYLQDFTNGLLTSGKRAIVKGIQKLDK